MTLEDWGWSPFFARQLKCTKQLHGIPARVIRGEKNYYRVWSEQGELWVRFAGRMRHRAGGRADLPVVGDWVTVLPQPGERGTVENLLERHSAFSRNLPGRRKRKGAQRAEQQVIAANIDLIFIVSGLDRDFNLRRIERYLTLVGNSGAAGVILLNKADLCDDPETAAAQVRSIAGETPIHSCSAIDPDQLDIFTPYLIPGRTIALLGSSGVGKSTLLNALLGEPRQKVGAVSRAQGKGRHTTTHRELFLLPQGGILMDNPGMRELHLWGDEEDLAESFPDIEALACDCRFSDCRHRKEPGCAVLAAVAVGDLDARRLDHYLRLQDELENLEPWKK